MKYKNIIYKNNELRRINKKTAEKILNHPSIYEGIVLYILPVNANPESYWINGFTEFKIENISFMDSIDNNNFINEYIYYNCNNELGNYLKYYVTKGAYINFINCKKAVK